MKSIAQFLKNHIQRGGAHSKAESILPNESTAPRTVTGSHHLGINALPIELWSHIIDLLVTYVLQGWCDYSPGSGIMRRVLEVRLVCRESPGVSRIARD
jgi:hypothetical protein